MKEVKKNPTFSEVAELFKQEHWPTLQYNTLRGYNTALNRAKNYFGDTSIDAVTSKNIDTYIKDYSSIKSKDKLPAAKTVRNRFLMLQMIFNFACKEGFITINPTTCVRIPQNLEKKERSLPTKEEVDIIKNNIDAPFGLIFYMALYTGCRYGELLALQWKDICFSNNYISITKSLYFENNNPKLKSTKTKKGIRKVILLDKLATVLIVKSANKDLDEFVFSQNGKPLTHKRAESLIREYRQITGTHILLHSLRHFFCSECFECGLDIKITQLLMGHSDASTTLNIYTHIREGKLLQDAAKLNSMDF